LVVACNVREKRAPPWVRHVERALRAGRNRRTTLNERDLGSQTNEDL